MTEALLLKNICNWLDFRWKGKTSLNVVVALKLNSQNQNVVCYCSFSLYWNIICPILGTLFWFSVMIQLARSEKVVRGVSWLINIRDEHIQAFKGRIQRKDSTLERQIYDRNPYCDIPHIIYLKKNTIVIMF